MSLVVNTHMVTDDHLNLNSKSISKYTMLDFGTKQHIKKANHLTCIPIECNYIRTSFPYNAYPFDLCLRVHTNTTDINGYTFKTNIIIQLASSKFVIKSVCLTTYQRLNCKTVHLSN